MPEIKVGDLYINLANPITLAILGGSALAGVQLTHKRGGSPVLGAALGAGVGLLLITTLLRPPASGQ